MADPPVPAAEPPPAERMFNAPPLALGVAASILLSYLAESFAPDPNAVQRLLGLSPEAVASGRVWTFLTVLVVHAGWTHAGLNALGALAFGAPVARAFGVGGGARFLAFYVLCGLAAALGWLALHWAGEELLVGASGAVYGLMGASSRLIDRRGQALAPFRSRTVLAMAGGAVAANGLLALGWIDVGAGGAPIAWDAHVGGYLAGLLLIGPMLGRKGPAPPHPALRGLATPDL